MTSSPSADPCDATAVDKPPDANTAAENTAGAYVHGMGAPLDIDATNIHRIDMKPKDTVPAQEGTVPGPSHDDGSTSHVPAAHNGMERRASSTEEAQSSTVTKASSGTSAQDGSLESAHNTTSTIDPQTQHRQALARQDHVMSNASQTRSKDISNDSTRQNPEPVHPSDDAVCFRPTCYFVSSLTQRRCTSLGPCQQAYLMRQGPWQQGRTPNQPLQALQGPTRSSWGMS